MSGRGSLSSRAKGEVGRAAPWRLAVGVLAIVILAGALLWFRPWEGGTAEENVRFDYQMWFYYYGSEENVPLDNLQLYWSAPKVDNSLPELLEGITTWELYYIEDDNTLTLQATEVGIVNLRGDRTSQLGMYGFGYDPDGEYGAVLTAWFNRLYPREVFVRLGYCIVDKKNADKLTLKVYGQTDSVASWYAIGQENQAIDFSHWVGLWRENALVEQFQWAQKNMTYGSSWLWPVT